MVIRQPNGFEERMNSMMEIKSSLKWIFSISIVMTMLSSCSHDPVIEPVAELNTVNGTLRLHVVPEWEGAPLALFSEYTNVSNYRTTVELLKMYFSEIQLASANGSVPVTDIELFNLDGPKQTEWSVPVGTYTALYAGLGVPEDLNHTDPSTYPVGHPLGLNSATYWTWNSGYRFVMFEGRYDPDPTSIDPLTSSYSMHTGIDTCYAYLNLIPSSPITISENGTTDITIRVAVDRFFYSSTETVDLATENAAHGSNLPLALKLTRNVVSSISLD